MKLTVFGEILWDIFEDEKKIGGAPFNFAAHAAAEGADVSFISAVGSDALGDGALKECRRLNIPTEFISKVPRPTGTCRVSLKDGTPFYDLSGDMAWDHISMPENFSPEGTLYFGTLARRSEESRASFRRLVKTGRFDDIFLDVNIRQDCCTPDLLEESLNYATILKFSREESSAFNIPGNLKEICRELMNKYSRLRLIIVTLDSEGAFVYKKSGEVIRSPKPECRVVSTVGAGDAFSAAFLVNYKNSLPLEKCLEKAVALASFVCEHTEAVPQYPMDDIRKWKAVYRLLNKVETEVFDCGTLCGCACCTCRGSESEMGIYLFPGEHRILREAEKEEKWLDWEIQTPKETGMPSSWRGPVYFVNCKTPPECPRKWRPLQCRTFPLKPVISDTGVLEMIWDDDDLPYSCPIIEKNMPIHDSFYKATYTVWMHLLKDPRIFDLVLSWS